MENKVIARTLKLLSQLMELHDMNPFKVRSISNAARKIDKFPQSISSINPDELEKIEGIGKSTAAKIMELLETGRIRELEDLRAATPEGIVELLSLKGLGPKKLMVIWKELGIENAGELYYACNENRLVEARGFGIKTQEEIGKLLDFALHNQGKFPYVAAAGLAEDLEKWLGELPGVRRVSPTGEFRRRGEVLTGLEFLVAAEDESKVAEALSASGFFQGSGVPPPEKRGAAEDGGLPEKDGLPQKPGLPQKDGRVWRGVTLSNIAVSIRFSPETEFAWRLLLGTGHKAHIERLGQVSSLEEYRNAGSEQEIYRGLGLEYIEPELREGLEEISWAASGQLPRLIRYEDLKGCLHNHTTYSDGIHTLEEMALQCIQNGYDYLGISDHSRSAFYAGGLSEEEVRRQQEEIEQLNKKLAPFRIFKGIESDILYDGSLDYPGEIL
ncbi:MAG TPA: helix-hairpin-helix domain-containing protein, partial [Anseongella sp.]|nr:helix-hairpin-helix domain-containing protein [Anseongella sp.]